MNANFDILLHHPLPLGLSQGLMFILFAVHLLFVLLMLGSAIIAVGMHLSRPLQTSPMDDRPILDKLFVFKTLAISFGVAPILLMQVGHSVPFLTAIRLLAPYWLMLFVLIIAAFAGLEVLHHRSNLLARGRLVFGIGGLLCLMAVAAIFATVLSTTERPGIWPALYCAGETPMAVNVHVLLRWMHVIGAAVVIASAYFLVRPARHSLDQRQAAIWLGAGLAVELVLGLGLYFSLEPPRSTVILILMGTGVVLTVVLGFHAHRLWRGPATPGRATIGVTVALLVVMLAARQGLQHKALMPLERLLADRANVLRSQVAVEAPESPTEYAATSHSTRGNGALIYMRSCAFCHGEVGNGAGEDAHLLAVPPENLTALRIKPAYLMEILRDGRCGSGMPYFSFYTAWELQHLAEFLRNNIGLREHLASPETAVVSAEHHESAVRAWHARCASCHGADGQGQQGSALRPPSPDLRQLTMTEQAAFDVITNGYPGTAMRGNDDLPEPLRRLLARYVRAMYQAAAGDPV